MFSLTVFVNQLSFWSETVVVLETCVPIMHVVSWIMIIYIFLLLPIRWFAGVNFVNSETIEIMLCI